MHNRPKSLRTNQDKRIAKPAERSLIEKFACELGNGKTTRLGDPNNWKHLPLETAILLIEPESARDLRIYSLIFGQLLHDVLTSNEAPNKDDLKLRATWKILDSSIQRITGIVPSEVGLGVYDVPVRDGMP